MVQFETYLFQLPIESLIRSPELLGLQRQLFVLLFALPIDSMQFFLFVLVLL